MEIPPVCCWLQYSRRTGASVHLLTTSIGESHGPLELDVHPLPPRSALLLVSCPVLPAASLEVILGAFPTSFQVCSGSSPHLTPAVAHPGQSHHCLHSVAWSTPDCSVSNPSPLTDLQHSNESVGFFFAVLCFELHHYFAENPLKVSCPSECLVGCALGALRPTTFPTPSLPSSSSISSGLAHPAAPTRVSLLFIK